MGRKFSSTAGATALATAVTGSATTMSVGSVAGLPAVPFTLIVDYGTISEEIVEVTGVAGLSLTVIRGVDGTAGLPHQVGALVRHGATARDFRDFVNHSEASTSVHGVTSGNVVGTSQAQTLTNKTLDGATNTVTNLPTAALANSAVTTAKIGDAQVTTPKLADGSVTTAKQADGSTTTAKLADGAVTAPKIASVTPEKVTGGTTITVPQGRFTSTTDATASSTAHAVQVGPTAGANLALDGDEILGRNNGVEAKVNFPSGITGLPAPTVASDAATKTYVDAPLARIATATYGERTAVTINTSGNVNLTYPVGRFNVVPIVVGSISDGTSNTTAGVVRFDQLTTSGCRLIVSGIVGTATFFVSWLAIQN